MEASLIEMRMATTGRGPTRRTGFKFVTSVGTQASASNVVPEPGALQKSRIFKLGGSIGTQASASASGLEEGNPRYDGEMRIELITTGSELLLGQVLNSHPGYLSEFEFGIGKSKIENRKAERAEGAVSKTDDIGADWDRVRK